MITFWHNRKAGVFILAILFFIGPIFIQPAQAALLDRVSGRILLDVQQNGEAWYVYPENSQRYYLGRPDQAFAIMRFLGLGITSQELYYYLENNFPQRLAGKILLDVEQNGEAYYVYPNDLKGYYLGRPDQAFSIMKDLGLGITSQDLGQLPVGYLNTSNTSSNLYQSYVMSLENGSFSVKSVSLARDKFTMITAVSTSDDCYRDCPVKSLDQYVFSAQAEIGIHGSYFCPEDYADCQDKSGSFTYPVYDTESKIMVNSDQIKYHTRPLIGQDSLGEYFYFNRADKQFISVDHYGQQQGAAVTAALGNFPSLVEQGEVVADLSDKLEPSQRLSGVRGSIGFNEEKVFLVIAQKATVEDMAYIMKALGCDYALNLDGGGSAALYYQGEYKIGPGRSLPNAILFKRK